MGDGKRAEAEPKEGWEQRGRADSLRQKQLLMESPRGEQSPHHLGPRRRRKKLSAVGYEKEGVRWRGLWLEW